MRTIPIYIILYLFVCLNSCEQKVDITAEEAAIIAVNEKQMTAFVHETIRAKQKSGYRRHI
jgi:hypothetical protein